MAVQHTYQSQSVDGGVAFVVDVGTALPTDATTALSSEVEAGSLGTLTDSGLSIGENRSSNVERDFDGADYVTVQSEYSGLFRFTLFDVDLETVKALLHGDDKVEWTAATAEHGNQYHIKHSADQLPLKSFVFWTKSGKKRERQVVQYGRVDSIGERLKQNGQTDKVEVTIRASKNDNGDYFDTYGDDGETVSGP